MSATAGDREPGFLPCSITPHTPNRLSSKFEDQGAGASVLKVEQNPGWALTRQTTFLSTLTTS